MLARDSFRPRTRIAGCADRAGSSSGRRTTSLDGTYQNGHPGVMMMWIGLLSQGPYALRFADRVHGSVRGAGLVTWTGWRRRGSGSRRSGGGGGRAPSDRLFGLGTGVLTGLALAAEPFLVATSSSCTSMGRGRRSSCSARRRRRTIDGGRRRRDVVLAGAAPGLALLSKMPALFLVAFVPLVAVGTVARGVLGTRRGATRNEVAGTAALPAIRRALIDLVVWGTVALATFVVLWTARALRRGAGPGGLHSPARRAANRTRSAASSSGRSAPIPGRSTIQSPPSFASVRTRRSACWWPHS